MSGEPNIVSQETEGEFKISRMSAFTLLTPFWFSYYVFIFIHFARVGSNFYILGSFCQLTYNLASFNLITSTISPSWFRPSTPQRPDKKYDTSASLIELFLTIKTPSGWFSPLREQYSNHGIKLVSANGLTNEERMGQVPRSKKLHFKCSRSIEKLIGEKNDSNHEWVYEKMNRNNILFDERC